MLDSGVVKAVIAVLIAVLSALGLTLVRPANSAAASSATQSLTIDSEVQSANSRLAAHLADPHPGTPEDLTHPLVDHASAGRQTTATAAAPASQSYTAAAATTSAAAAATTSAATASVPGLDVSGYQGNVNWAQVASEGARFAYVKATEGTYYVDSAYFTEQYNGSYSAGLVRGAYHFAIPNNSTGAAQADYFVAHGGGWSPDGHTLPGMLDIEYNPYGSECYGLTPAQMVSWINSFVGEYHLLTRKLPVIYTTTDWWTTCTGNATGFADGLAIANYGSSPYPLPASWSSYNIWQYADQGVFPGDQDRFNGTYQQMVLFASGYPVLANYTGSDRLLTSHTLLPDQALLSADGRYTVVMQTDGNLVEYTFGPRVVWASGTYGHPGARLAMQADGNLVIYQGSTPIWNTGTWGLGPSFAVIQADNNFVVYTNGLRATWASRYGRLL